MNKVKDTEFRTEKRQVRLSIADEEVPPAAPEEEKDVKEPARGEVRRSALQLWRLSKIKLDNVRRQSGCLTFAEALASISPSSPTSSRARHPSQGSGQLSKGKDLSKRAMVITSRLSRVGTTAMPGRLDWISLSGSLIAKQRGLRVFENSYRLGPGQGQGFNKKTVKEALRSVITAMLPEGAKYDRASAPMLCLRLSELIRSKMKLISANDMPRYKWICHVILGDSQGQCAVVGSRCLWSSHTDNFQSVKFENSSYFLVASVYGVYFE